jgi:hypothetical protein
MTRNIRPLAEITTEAIKILYREIGIVDTLRFVNQYTAGYGDYTAQRDQLFAGMTLEDIISDIKKRNRRSHPQNRRRTEQRRTAPDRRVRSRRNGRRKAI